MSNTQMSPSESPSSSQAPVAESGATASRGEPIVKVEHLVKHFRRGDGSLVRAIDDVSLEVHAGEFVVLLGPSGCGKTTLLRSIAGLETPDAGTIQVHGARHFSSKDRINLAPQKRRLGMIFQSYALWPHMTALRNVTYPLECGPERISKKEIAQRARHVLELVGIPELEGQYPNQMSGGQQQRVALARALVAGNDLVLFDEPLSNVDAKVREQLRLELAMMQRKLGFAAVYVTHDQTEAMELAHKIAVLNTGRVAQLGPPREIYERPGSRYVANFIGTTNELAGTVTGITGTQVLLHTPLGEALGVAGTEGLQPGDEVVGVWRPERGGIVDDDGGRPNCWPGAVAASLFAGSHTEHSIRLSEGSVRLWQSGVDLVEQESTVWVHVPPGCLRILRPQDDASGEADDVAEGGHAAFPVGDDTYLVGGQ